MPDFDPAPVSAPDAGICILMSITLPSWLTKMGVHHRAVAVDHKVACLALDVDVANAQPVEVRVAAILLPDRSSLVDVAYGIPVGCPWSASRPESVGFSSWKLIMKEM